MSQEQPRRIAAWVGRRLTQPRDHLSRWERAFFFPYDLGRYGARQLREDRAPQMAGALAYRTLFALLPILVVATVLVRAFRGFDSMLSLFAGLFTKLGLDELRPAVPSGAHPTVAGGVSLSEMLLDLMREVERINLAAIGWVGLAVVVYSAVSLMVTIEKCFNAIYRAPEGRPWIRRFTVYWTVLTLGPLAIALTVVAGGWLQRHVADVQGWASFLRFAPVVWGFLATWIVMWLFYWLVPNTAVAVRPAMMGAFVSAMLLGLGMRSLGAYVQNAVSLSQLYGSLGLIPVFMFWVYVMWLVVLFGLEVAATLQMLGGRRLEEIESRRARTGLVDPASVLTVMQAVARRFQSSRPTTPRDVVDETSISEQTVARMLERLAEAGFLHRLDTEDGALVLARPPDQISAAELIEIGFRMVDEGAGDSGPPFLQRLREAQRNLARQVTLAALAAAAPSSWAAGESAAE
jgi:membrane protein